MLACHNSHKTAKSRLFVVRTGALQRVYLGIFKFSDNFLSSTYAKKRDHFFIHKKAIIKLKNYLKRTIFDFPSWKGGMEGFFIQYLEHHSACPLVRNGSTHPLSRKRMCPPPEPKGGGNTRLRLRRLADPIRTTGEKAWHSVYSVQRGLIILLAWTKYL